MGIVNILLDKAKETCSPSNDAALAASLGVEKSAVSNWRNGRAYPNVVACEQIAHMIGAKPLQVISAINEARAVSKAEKAVWHRLAASAAALVLLVGAIPLPGHATDNAQRTDSAVFSRNSRILYIMSAGWSAACDILRWLRWSIWRKPSGPHIEAFTA